MILFDKNLYLQASEDLRDNPGQWGAYNSTRHCVVLAGPGSGKTKTLTIKIARTLAEDVDDPRGIACITYNNECARELEERLSKLGIEPSKRIFIGTVHSFSLTQIILPYSQTAGLNLPQNFRVATKQEQDLALQRAFDTVVAQGQMPWDWGLRLSRYRKHFIDRNDPGWATTNPEMVRAIQEYENILRRQGLIDFDDMPLLAVRALRENEWLQKAILAKYPILFVDEYQDLGTALHAMVTGLCFTTGIRLFAVGDADQSIYGFTGANPLFLEELSERQDVETLRLPFNYRCGTQIIEASRHALGENRGYVAPDDAEEGAVYFRPSIGSYEKQANYLFRTLIPEVLGRYPEIQLGEIAILYPAAWIGNAVADTADANNFQYIRADQNALYPRSSKLMRWLELCAVWSCEGWRTGSPKFSKITQMGHQIFAETLTSDELKLAFQRSLIHTLINLRNEGQLLRAYIGEIKQNFLDDLLNNNRTLRDDEIILARFLQETEDGGRIDEITVEEFAGIGVGNKRITLSTLHSSKGREFSVVFLFGMDRRRIPRDDASTRQILESRRLFYVGITRAKKEVYLMYTNASPSIFVQELQQRLAQQDEE